MLYVTINHCLVKLAIKSQLDFLTVGSRLSGISLAWLVFALAVVNERIMQENTNGCFFSEHSV